MVHDCIKEGASIPKWISHLDDYIKNIENTAREEGYAEGFTIGRRLTYESELIINYALKLQSTNDLHYMAHLLEAVKCYNDALDEIIDPTVAG